MRHDVRKKLLADYAVALVAERESWARLQDPDLTEAQRCRTLGEWKQIAAGLKTLVRQLRDAPIACVPVAPGTSPSGEGDSHPGAESADEREAVADAVAVPVISKAPARRRPFHVHCLVASLRLMKGWRARLEPAAPRLGSL